jgi:hypothetical protein
MGKNRAKGGKINSPNQGVAKKVENGLHRDPYSQKLEEHALNCPEWSEQIRTQSLSYGGQITGLLTGEAEYKGKEEINVNRQLFVAMNAPPWAAKGLAGQNVTDLVLENLNDCILRLRAMGRASKVNSAIEKINHLAELEIGVLRGSWKLGWTPQPKILGLTCL